MGRRRFSREFKISAVALVQQQGYTVPQAAQSSHRYTVSPRLTHVDIRFEVFVNQALQSVRR